ncbi:hypothetical protein NQZ68_032717 [Dissostichus eleginoides]|nr:hypothetical protein NQZ68_032717 [Dissostichus eleginoides]
MRDLVESQSTPVMHGLCVKRCGLSKLSSGICGALCRNLRLLEFKATCTDVDNGKHGLLLRRIGKGVSQDWRSFCNGTTSCDPHLLPSRV